jgi:hypothetical protein
LIQNILKPQSFHIMTKSKKTRTILMYRRQWL